MTATTAVSGETVTCPRCHGEFFLPAGAGKGMAAIIRHARDEHPARCAGNWEGGQVRCPADATGTVSCRCECGHLTTDACCDDCQARVARLAAGGHLVCMICEDEGCVPMAHACPVVLVSGEAGQ
jgi:hypothetical protein